MRIYFIGIYGYGGQKGWGYGNNGFILLHIKHCYSKISFHGEGGGGGQRNLYGSHRPIL